MSRNYELTPVMRKRLERKRSLWSLIKERGGVIIGTIIAIAVIVASLLCSAGLAAYQNVSLSEGFGLFLGLVLAVMIVACIIVAGFLVIRMAFTYVRAFNRYTYLPLTKSDAAILGIDNDPIAFFKTLHDMMCYKSILLFGEEKAIYDNETENKLKELFYQLFFARSEGTKPIIIDTLNDKKKLTELYCAMCIDGIGSDLISPLENIHEIVDEIEAEDETVIDAIVFKSPIQYMYDNDVRDAEAIVLTNRYVYFSNVRPYTTSIDVPKNCDTLEKLLKHKMFLTIPESYSMV